MWIEMRLGIRDAARSGAVVAFRYAGRMTRIVLDVDTGIDDALALCYLLAAQRDGECELLGVVGTYGNVLASTAVRNSRNVLELFGDVVSPASEIASEASPVTVPETVFSTATALTPVTIPVLRGCPCPSWADGFAVDEGCARFHGGNGLGNARIPAAIPVSDPLDHVAQTPAKTPANAQAAANTNNGNACNDLPDRFAASGATLSIGGERHDVASAADLPANRPVEWRDWGRTELPEGVRFIVDQVRKYGREVTVLATGPLTDVDLAIQSAPDIVDHLKLVIMGGSLTQEGNCYDLICETNIFQDPEAANRVFRSGADVTMIGLDVTHQCLLTREHVESWRSSGSERGRFLASMTDFYINANESSDPIFLAGSPLHDPLAAAVALDPSLVDCFDVNMMVETATGNGHGFRGRTIGDPTRLRNPHKTAHVALSVDADRFVDRFVARLASLC